MGLGRQDATARRAQSSTSYERVLSVPVGGVLPEIVSEGTQLISVSLVLYFL